MGGGWHFSSAGHHLFRLGFITCRDTSVVKCSPYGSITMGIVQRYYRLMGRSIYNM